jgi:hypothetical protein
MITSFLFLTPQIHLSRKELHFAITAILDLANYHGSLVICSEKPIILPRKVWHFGCDSNLADEAMLRSGQMADVIVIVVTVLFFIISWLYVIGCDRL